MSSALPIRYRFVHLLLMIVGIIHVTTTAEEDARDNTLLRVKRQSGAFTRTYTFTPQSCNAGSIAGAVSASGATYYSVQTPNSNIGVTSTTGNIFLANYLTRGVPYTVTIQAWANQAAFNNGAGTNPLGTTTVTVTCQVASSTPGGTPTGAVGSAPVAGTQALTATSCSVPGTFVGSATATSATAVTYAAVTTGSPFTVATNGQITLNQVTSGTQTLVVRATNAYGSTQFQVQITCPSSTAAVFPAFTSPLYTMSASPCTAGAIVGTVIATPTGTVNYQLASAAPVTVNSATGQIQLTSAPITSPFNFAVTASNSRGTTATTVSLTCTSSSSGGTTPNRIYFTVPVYTFYPTGTACNAGGVLGQVGVVGATTAPTFTITSTNPGYAISQAGVITNPTTGPVSGTYTVQASANSGQTATATFIVNRMFCTTSSGGTTGTCPAFAQTSYTFTPAGGCGFFAPIGTVSATCSTGGAVTYSLPFAAVNNFGIDPTSGSLYATAPSTTCQTVTVTATVQDGTSRTSTAQVAIACNGGTCTPTTGGSTGCTQVGQPGCGDIG
ncbi:mucin-5AC-like [Paramacrobiotus metropolitanus]|uniref:mucin-5AC-like n=1 Tax=Paramacrobiotus metropolitanus TaxID=2943436 RepID=UPI0024461171|nr:mucin-5AC-like [Paramacrobiotus metropolitanus]